MPEAFWDIELPQSAGAGCGRGLLEPEFVLQFTSKAFLNSGLEAFGDIELPQSVGAGCGGGPMDTRVCSSCTRLS